LENRLNTSGYSLFNILEVLFISLSDYLGTAIPYTKWAISDIAFAVIALVLAFIVSLILISIFKKILKRTKMPDLAAHFLIQLITALLYVAVLLVFVSALGITVSSIILGLSAVIGLILGFGMQDTLTNLGAGIWLAVLEPFKEKDYITVSGQTGYVKGIGLMSVELVTSDKVFIMIPNKLVWNSAIVNMTHFPTRRFNLNMSFALVGDVDGTIKKILDVLNKNPEVLQTPEPKISISNLTDTNADFQIRFWSHAVNINTALTVVKEDLLRAFDLKD